MGNEGELVDRAPASQVQLAKFTNLISISRAANPPEQLLLDRWQRRPHPRGDDRERITRARQAAEALFTPSRQITEQLVSDSQPADQSARKPRVLAISPTAPIRHEEVEAPVSSQQQTAPEPEGAVCTHPDLGEVRNEASPNCRGLRGCHRRDREHSPQSLTALRLTAAAVTLAPPVKGKRHGGWRFLI